MGQRFSRSSSHIHVVLLGLENAGKSSILARLMYDMFIEQASTQKLCIETFNLRRGPGRGRRFAVWDSSGSEEARHLWKTYTKTADVILYIVDSANEEKFSKSRDVLHDLINSNVFPKHAVFLVLANKQDLPEAKKPEELFSVLKLKNLTRLCLRGCSAKEGTGLDDIFTHIYLLLRHSKKFKSSS